MMFIAIVLFLAIFVAFLSLTDHATKKATDMTEDHTDSSGKDPLARVRRVPFVITSGEVRAWWNQRGPARGMIIDGNGTRLWGSGGAKMDSFRMLSAYIKSALAGNESAKSFINRPEVARNIRNRPRLKAMLGGAQ